MSENLVNVNMEGTIMRVDILKVVNNQVIVLLSIPFNVMK